MDILFDGDGCMIKSKGKVVSRVRKTGVMYVWDVRVQHEGQVNEIAASAEAKGGAAVWHARLGHLSLPRMRAVARLVDSLPDMESNVVLNGACEGCACGKMAANPFSHRTGSHVKTQAVLELVHSDVMGPMTPK
jgi:hypothetical protein